MNTKKSHKIFSLIMLVLIVASVVASAGIAVYNIYEYNKEMKLQEDLYAGLNTEAADSSEV